MSFLPPHVDTLVGPGARTRIILGSPSADRNRTRWSIMDTHWRARGLLASRILGGQHPQDSGAYGFYQHLGFRELMRVLAPGSTMYLHGAEDPWPVR